MVKVKLLSMKNTGLELEKCYHKSLFTRRYNDSIKQGDTKFILQEDHHVVACSSSVLVSK